MLSINVLRFDLHVSILRCGHCKTLAPEYENAAQRLNGSVPFAKVDATVEKDLAKR